MRRCVVALAIVCGVRPASHACAPAPPRGEEVKIADEEAVIVWDPDNHVERFIRKAAFESTARRFGFLVPTPSVPKLGEVSDSVFDELAMAIRPEVRNETSGFELGCSCAARMKGGDDDALALRASAVRVIQTARVAGFDATTVAADDANALAAWLANHGFDRSPALTAWLERYVADRWTITAFVVATDEPAGARSYGLATRAVQMTFATDRPFYPYREPARPTSAANRLLRVYFISTRRYAATLGSTTPWSARVLFAGPLATITEALGPYAAPAAVVTAFHDASSPRNGSDELYFAASADQSPVAQPPVIRYKPREVPVDLVALAVLVVGVAALLFRRRGRRA
jgi:hypothetical protein